MRAQLLESAPSVFHISTLVLMPALHLCQLDNGNCFFMVYLQNKEVCWCLANGECGVSENVDIAFLDASKFASVVEKPEHLSESIEYALEVFGSVNSFSAVSLFVTREDCAALIECIDRGFMHRKDYALRIIASAIVLECEKA